MTMKRYVRCVFAVETIGIIGLIALCCSMVFSYLQYQSAALHLRTLIRAVSDDVASGQDAAALSQTLLAEDAALRVTLLDGEGTVRFDTRADLSQTENHLSREEISQAMEDGFGQAIRYSQTTGTPSLYVAHRLDSGLILRLGYPLSAINQFVRALLLISLAVCALALAAVWLAAGRFTARLLRPYAQLSELMEDGLGGASTGFLSRGAFREAQPLLDNLAMKIDRLNYDTEEIRRTQRLRSDFVANASHEMKSPLTSIKGFAELLNNDMVDGEAQRHEYLGRIVAESERLLSVIDDILQLSRAESGEIRDAERVDLRALSEEIRRALEPLARKKNISINVAGGGFTLANAQEMWEIIYNLIDNSIRYGREGGYVNVRLADDEITVVDNGIGIPADQLSRVFERFYRVDKSRSRLTGGTGLGLSIVRHVALKYGGDVRVESREGEGTAFWVTLNKKDAHPGGADKK